MVYLDFSPSNSVSNTTSYNKQSEDIAITSPHFNSPLCEQGGSHHDVEKSTDFIVSVFHKSSITCTRPSTCVGKELAVWWFWQVTSTSTYIDCVLPRVCDPGHGSAGFGREHDFVFDQDVLIHHTVHITSRHVTAHLEFWWVELIYQMLFALEIVRKKLMFLRHTLTLPNGSNSHVFTLSKAGVFTPFGM